jgi:hypothetical protein
MSRKNIIIPAISWTLGLAVIYFSVGSLVDGKNLEQTTQNQESSTCKILVGKILDAKFEGENNFAGNSWTNTCIPDSH